MKFGIVGAGRIGGWLARLLAAEHEVTVFDTAEVTWLRADISSASSLQDLCQRELDCVICAVPLEATLTTLRALDDLLPSAVAVGDVASIKRAAFSVYHGAKRRFVSLHPMFGPTFGDLGALNNEVALILSESDPGLQALFRDLWQNLGIEVRNLSFTQHEQLMVSSLVAPYMVSLMLASVIPDPEAPGTTLKRHRELTRGILNHPPEFLCEILHTDGAAQLFEQAAAALGEFATCSPRALQEHIIALRSRFFHS